MKKLAILIGLFAVITAGVFVFLKDSEKTNIEESQNESVLGEESDSPNKLLISLNGNEYKIVYYLIEDLSMLDLIQNFQEKTTSDKFVKENDCKFLASAGFYTEDSKPIGYFVTNGTEVSEFKSNSLLNGVLSINYFDTPRITRDVPKDALRIAIQTGPVLVENGSKLDLSMTRDQNARRVVALVTGSNELYFVVVYDSQSLYMGPELVEMKPVLSEFEKSTGIIIADAINLDGGTASAFYISGENSANQKAFGLSELSPVGSFFCSR